MCHCLVRNTLGKHLCFWIHSPIRCISSGNLSIVLFVLETVLCFSGAPQPVQAATCHVSPAKIAGLQVSPSTHLHRLSLCVCPGGDCRVSGPKTRRLRQFLPPGSQDAQLPPSSAPTPPLWPLHWLWATDSVHTQLTLPLLICTIVSTFLMTVIHCYCLRYTSWLCHKLFVFTVYIINCKLEGFFLYF